MIKLKKLNLSEIWKLYLLLKDGLENRDRKENFLDEIELLLKSSPPGTLFEVLSVLYDNMSMDDDISGMDALVMLVNGLNENGFYEFVDFIEVLKNDPSR